MFEQSLLKKDREELIELFLAQGVRVHKFLNHKKLKLLFEKAEDREFFLNVCMEQVLGLFLVSKQNNLLSKSFMVFSDTQNITVYIITLTFEHISSTILNTKPDTKPDTQNITITVYIITLTLEHIS